MRTLQEDNRLHTRTIQGLANPTPLIVYGEAIITKQSAGVFTLGFPSLKTLLSGVVTNCSGAAYIATCSIQADGSLIVWCWNTAQAQVDPTFFSFIVTGYPK